MTSPSAVDMQYVGHDELLVLDQAVNYNRYIAGLFAAALPKESPRSAPVVIDFGAGIGTISRHFVEATSIAPLAVEIDPNQREILAARGLNACAGLHEVAPGSVDLVFSSNVLEHIENDVDALRQIHRALREGGRVALWVPAFPLLWTALDQRVLHFRRYTAATAVAALREAGFSTCSVCEYRDSVGFGLALLFKVIGNREGQLTASSIRFYDRWLFPFSRVFDGVCRRWFGKNLYVVAAKA